MNEYPSRLIPLPLIEGYTIVEPARVQRTEMQSGYIRQRKTASHSFYTYNVSFSFSEKEFGIFEAWKKYKINDGTDWFPMPLKTPLGVRVVNVRFIQPIQTQVLPKGRYIITAVLETDNYPTMSEKELDNA